MSPKGRPEGESLSEQREGNPLTPNGRPEGESPRAPRWLGGTLPWLVIALAALVIGMPALTPLFAWAFPELDRPMYAQDSFGALLAAHVGIVALSSAISVTLGLLAGVFVTRAAGRAFRPTVEGAVAIGQTVPPVAVLAIAAPLIGFGELPALIALALYGLLPIVQNTIAGLEAVAPAPREAAAGLGMTPGQVLRRIELPLALPVIVSGIRVSVIINIGTATIASTVGARTLGAPILIGLNGFNPAYVLQGAMVVALLAITVDAAFERLTPASR
jgi:osmoprotectant transport system permease protein